MLCVRDARIGAEGDYAATLSWRDNTVLHDWAQLLNLRNKVMCDERWGGHDVNGTLRRATTREAFKCGIANAFRMLLMEGVVDQIPNKVG